MTYHERKMKTKMEKPRPFPQRLLSSPLPQRNAQISPTLKGMVKLPRVLKILKVTAAMLRSRDQCPRRTRSARSARSLLRSLKSNVHRMRKPRGLEMTIRPGATKRGLIQSLRRKMIQARSCQRISPMTTPKRRRKTAKMRKNSRNKTFLRHRLPSPPFTLL